MSPLDKQLQATLQRLTSALKQGTKSYLLADHLALARMGPLALSAVKDGGLTYVDNPATHWVLDSFKARSPGPSGGKQRAEHATQVLDELTALNRGKGIAEHVLQTQKGIADRIDKRIASSGADPQAAEWFDRFRAAWNKEQPMTITGDLEYDGYPDSPASPSPQRYLNSFMSLIDSLPPHADVFLLTGSSAIVHNVSKFAEDDLNVHTVVVGEEKVSA